MVLTAKFFPKVNPNTFLLYNFNLFFYKKVKIFTRMLNPSNLVL